MATLPKEQVTQRAHRTMVSVDASPAKDANSEVVWEAETVGLDTTMVKTIDENQRSRDEIHDRLTADPKVEF